MLSIVRQWKRFKVYVCVCVHVCTRVRVCMYARTIKFWTKFKILVPVIYVEIYCIDAVFVHMKLNQPSSDHSSAGAGGRRWGKVEKRSQSAFLEARHFTACSAGSQYTVTGFDKQTNNNLSHIWTLRWNQNAEMIFSKLFGFIFTSYILNPGFGIQIKVWNKWDSLYVKYGYKTILTLVMCSIKHNIMLWMV